MLLTDDTRRRFVSVLSGLGLGGTLLPGPLLAQVQQTGETLVSPAMLADALAVAGLSFSEEDQKAMLQAVNRNLTSYEELRRLEIPNDVAPPFYFSSLVPGMKVNRTREPLHFGTPAVKRPANLEDAAFWPILNLAQLIKTRQVTSAELTEMYLARLHRYNEKLNCVVTFLDELARLQARQADQEIAAGRYRGPLHGIPWGAKDIIAVKGYKTTWGSDAFKDQVLDDDASVVEMLREAGAVLLAKLTTGELAQGDRWFGGQTRNPWNLSEGSSGSSAGPASATAAGLVAFGIGSETSGSILSPSARCGITGLRPTFGRVSRHGVMTLSWTQDRLGPLCRYVEDCAVVMSVIARPDNRDLSVADIPFNWNARFDIKKLRVGYLEGTVNEPRDQKALEQLQSLGFKPVPITVPESASDSVGFGVESAAFFADMIRTGRDKKMTNPSRAAGWRPSCLIPAVDYIQSQRTRMMMMMKMAEATAAADVYLVPANSGGGPGAARGAAPPTDGGTAGRGGRGGFPRGPLQRHFAMANSAGYPAVNLPNGFLDSGSPAAITFYARPFGEKELLAVAKAYQDATGFHTKHPVL
ncbi:MAG TPA: amidase [Candidatus Acidoferrales bacterium]|nr:amidase [Candidatus Acidoferrales bacterium]